MSDASADEHHAKGAAVYVGRLSLGTSIRSKTAILFVRQDGLAFHRPGRFEKYHAISYEAINFYDLGRRWNGMVLSISTNDFDYRFRFFRPRGDLAAIVVALNQRLQSQTRPLLARYALTQVSGDEDALQEDAGTRQDMPPPAAASPQEVALSGDPTTARADSGAWRTHPVFGRPSGGGVRVFAGERPSLTPLARAVPKLIILALALYSVIASGLWQKGVETITVWLQPTDVAEQIAVEPIARELDSHRNVPVPVEDNLAHVSIDLSAHADVAARLKAQRILMKMTLAQAAREADLMPATVENIEAGAKIVSLSDFLRYAKVMDLDIATTRQIIGRY